MLRVGRAHAGLCHASSFNRKCCKKYLVESQ